ncbi:MAG: NUDIX hydrolase [Burkholderiales bacterium]|nr:NUDIX hydrolase [Burkholderiales bacterium]
MSGIWRPRVTVAAVIEREGRFLLVEEEVRGRRVLNQPAGHLDPGESLLEAVVREVWEETAHRFAPAGLVGVYRWIYDKDEATFLRFCFFGGVSGHDPARALDTGIVALHWLTPEELQARRAEHRSPLVARCVEDYLAGRHFPLDVLSKDFA